MKFLLDTNVVSEWVKPQPSQNVVEWLAGADEDELFLSVITFAEIRRGVELLPAGRRRARLGRWLTEELPLRFEQRVLLIDQPVSANWGVVMARAQRAGFALGTMDGFVAATAETHGLTLVTRNLSDFRALGLELFDPWEVRT